MRALTLLILLSASVANAGPLTVGTPYNFHATIPGGFEPLSKKELPPNALYGYQRGSAADFQLLVIMQDTTEASHGPVDPKAFASGMATGTLDSSVNTELAWKNETLDVISGVIDREGTKLAFTAVEMPVPTHGIFIAVMGPGRVKPMAATLEELVGSFDSEVEWTERASGLELLGFLAGVAALIGVVVVVRRRRRAI